MCAFVMSRAAMSGWLFISNFSHESEREKLFQLSLPLTFMSGGESAGGKGEKVCVYWGESN